MKKLLAFMALLAALSAPWPHWVSGVIADKHIHNTTTRSGKVVTAWHLVIADAKDRRFTCNATEREWKTLQTGWYWICLGDTGVPLRFTRQIT